MELTDCMRRAYAVGMSAAATTSTGKAESRHATGEHLFSQPVLFQTVHGSRLYGLHQPTSDHDAFTVVAEARDPSPTARARRSFQQVLTLDDGTVADSYIIGLSAFLRMCGEGVPQVLEAMMAPPTKVDTFAAYRAAYRVNPHTTASTYRRAIYDHASKGTGRVALRSTVAPVKARRHAVRLGLNMVTALAYGRFTPVLSPAEKHTVLTVADSATFEADLLVLTGGAVDVTRPAPHRG